MKFKVLEINEYKNGTMYVGYTFKKQGKYYSKVPRLLYVNKDNIKKLVLRDELVNVEYNTDDEVYIINED